MTSIFMKGRGESLNNTQTAVEVQVAVQIEVAPRSRVLTSSRVDYGPC